MSDQYTLNLGSETIKVPAWATEATASKNAKFNEVSAKALDKLLQLQSIQSSATKDQTRLFDELVKTTKEDAKEQKKQTQAIQEGSKATRKALDDFSAAATASTSKIFEAFDKGSLNNLTAALGATGIFGGVLGFAASQVDSMSTAIINLANQGTGLGNTMQELLVSASKFGMGLQEYTEFIVSNGDALRALGNNTTEGAAALANLSDRVRRSAMNNNMFGLTMAELNEIMVEEVNIRRLSGMQTAQIADSVANSMDKLMTETTAMAAATGVDRRELLRERQRALSDVVLNARGMNNLQRDNMSSLAALFATRGGAAGEMVSQAIRQSERTGINFLTFNDTVAQMSVRSKGFLQELSNFYNDNASTMDSTEFKSRLLEMVSSLDDMFNDDDIKSLQRQATLGIEGATEMLELITGFRGIGGSLGEFEMVFADTADGLADTSNSLMALPAAMKETANAISKSTLVSVLDTLSVDVNDQGRYLVDAIRELGDNFGYDETNDEFRGLIGGIKETLSEFSGIAATLAVIVTSIVGSLKLLLAGLSGTGALATGLGKKAGSGLLNRLKSMIPSALGGAAAASGAGAAAKTGLASKILSAGSRLLGLPAAGLLTALSPTRMGDGTYNPSLDTLDVPYGTSLSEMNILNPGLDSGFTPGKAGSSPGYKVGIVGGMQGTRLSPDGSMMPTNVDPSVAWRFQKDMLDEIKRMRRALEDQQ